MKFCCLYCYKRAEFDDSEPETWLIDRYAAKGKYRHKCTECGAAMAPESFLMKDGVIHIDDTAMQAFSDCINAGICSLHDQYAPDCEDTTHIKPKCLHFLYKQAQDADRRFDGLEKLICRAQGKLIPFPESEERSDK